ncbi:hypothetical protein C9F11_03135 [Streptomyces sp. YIM 121038]|uniref:hypothetical protein n=1 Tax=unclassified Streptomyces TaxID=2593676 RepID=UPI001110E1D1|nr:MULTISPECIES: hypothetical protein [unclassified Streptomyces]QCX74330.1 hypothetical protein C9F11_03135 [Streptomyces sp. YIM 121038]
MRKRFTALALTLAVGLGGIVLAPTAGAAPPGSGSAAAAPLVKAPGFNVTGTWGIYQSNEIHATLNVTQDAQGNLTGTAAKAVGTATGPIEQGFVDGNYLYFVIPWTDGSKGRYIGSLGPDRRLSGVATDLSTPTSQADWNTVRTF